MLNHFLLEPQPVAAAAMDADFWDSQFLSSRLLSGNHHGLESLDDSRAYFTCPFCYVDTQLSLLCNHLQEEHCFDVKNAVCPVCALNLGKDVVGHFKVYHTSSIKTRRKSQKSGIWGGSLVGLNSRSCIDDANGSAPDPLLSPFLCGIPCLESKIDEIQELCCIDEDLSILEIESSKRRTMLDQSEDRDYQDSEKLRQRAEFCQQLIFSIIL